MGQVADISIPTGVVRPVLGCDVIQLYRIPSRVEALQNAAGRCASFHGAKGRKEGRIVEKHVLLASRGYYRSGRNFIYSTPDEFTGPRFRSLESSPMIRV